MIASLPMYDFPQARAANDRLWARIRDGLRAAGGKAPESLTRDGADLWPQWTSPDLVLSQTCGYPYRAVLHGQVTLIGTPDFGVEGCPPGWYRSVFVTRKDDPRRTLAAFDGARFAFNDDMSQSGWAAPQTHAAKLGIALPAHLGTGEHRLSAEAVAGGDADIASLDAVTWAHLQRWEHWTAALRPLALTDPTPGLPYISAKGADQPRMFRLIAAAIAGLSVADRAATGIRALIAIPAEHYLAVPTPPGPNGTPGARSRSA